MRQGKVAVAAIELEQVAGYELAHWSTGPLHHVDIDTGIGLSEGLFVLPVAE